MTPQSPSQSESKKESDKEILATLVLRDFENTLDRRLRRPRVRLCNSLPRLAQGGSSIRKGSSSYLHDDPKPTWEFNVGMPPDSGIASEEKTMEKWLRKYVTLRGHKLFQGEYKETDFNGCFKFLLRFFGGKFEDRRKWDHIDEWADSIAGIEG